MKDEKEVVAKERKQGKRQEMQEILKKIEQLEVDVDLDFSDFEWKKEK